MRTFALSLLIATFALTGQACADQIWPACSVAQDGSGYTSIRSDFYSNTLQVDASCRELTLEQVKKQHPDVAAKNKHHWEAVWNIMRFPERMIEYRIALYAFEHNIEILGIDSYGTLRFQNSPYSRINKSFVFTVPRCSKLTLTFLSPWPPSRYTVNFISTHTQSEVWRSQKVELAVPLPDARSGNPAAAMMMHYASSVKVEPHAGDELLKKCGGK